MQEPSLRSSRLAIAGGLAAIIAVGGGGFLLGRATAPEPVDRAPTVVAAPTPTPEPTPERARILGRADLAELAFLASDSLASGQPIPESVSEAGNRRFELVLPFGCSGPAGEGSSARLRWRYDEEAEALRIHVAPNSWDAGDWGMAGRSGVEAIEGFWIARPWSSSDDCPSRSGQTMATGIEPLTLPGQTLAVAQFFTADARRAALRDGRAFETVKRIPREEFDASRGFRVRLSGRIGGVPGADAPVRCIQPGGMDQRPICAIAVTLDEVRIENPIDEEVLASWPIGAD